MVTCNTLTSIVINWLKRLFCFSIYSPTRDKIDGDAVTVIVPKLRDTVKSALLLFPIIDEMALSTSSHSFKVDAKDTSFASSVDTDV